MERSSAKFTVRDEGDWDLKGRAIDVVWLPR